MKVFDSEEIRDTDDHNSLVYFARVYAIKRTVLYKNGLNQAVELQVQGSVDKAFTDPVAVGAAISAAASMSVPLYETMSDYFPYLRIVATCTIAPTSGSLSVWKLPQETEG